VVVSGGIDNVVDPSDKLCDNNDTFHDDSDGTIRRSSNSLILLQNEINSIDGMMFIIKIFIITIISSICIVVPLTIIITTWR